MPFCMAVFIITIGLSEIVTLQVRIPKENDEILVCECQRRKASLSAALKGEWSVRQTGQAIVRQVGQSAAASMTIEASLVLSLLIFASVSLILPMKILNTERKVQAGLEAVGESYSQYAYLQDVISKGDASSMEGADGYAKVFCHYLGAGVAEGFAQAQAMKHADTGAIRHATMVRSEIMEDGACFDLVLDYSIQMPFPVLGLGEIRRTARCRRRAWIGSDGKEGDGSPEAGEENDQIVYVGKDGTRYHCDRNCHYLANQLTAVSYEQAADSRNNSGGKYHACAVCGAKAGPGSTVYILPEGSSYHSTRICTAILAYVRSAKLSEVEHLGPCSYCSQ